MLEWSNKARVEVAVDLARDDAGRNRQVEIDKNPDTSEVGDSWDDPEAGVWVAAWVWVGVDDIHDALERHSGDELPEEEGAPAVEELPEEEGAPAVELERTWAEAVEAKAKVAQAKVEAAQAEAAWTEVVEAAEAAWMEAVEAVEAAKAEAAQAEAAWAEARARRSETAPPHTATRQSDGRVRPGH